VTGNRPNKTETIITQLLTQITACNTRNFSDNNIL